MEHRSGIRKESFVQVAASVRFPPILSKPARNMKVLFGEGFLMRVAAERGALARQRPAFENLHPSRHLTVFLTDAGPVSESLLSSSIC
jgi:hypothetical protein